MSASKRRSWRVNRLGRNVFDVRVPAVRKNGWEWWCLLTSDRHWDAVDSDRKLQKLHLEEAKERNAAIVDCGDFFDVISSRFDKRGTKGTIRPEYKVDDYLDAVVDDAASWFLPYAPNFVCIGVGNHEAKLVERQETNLTERLIALLNNRSKTSIYNGGFSGWVSFRFVEKNGKICGGVLLHYDHGYGGGGQVSHDLIQHHRRSAYLPDPDIICSGHTHDAWMHQFPRQRISPMGALYQDAQTHIKIPSYKRDYGDGYRGWHVTTGKPPKVCGAWWIRFYYSRKDAKIVYEPVLAK